MLGARIDSILSKKIENLAKKEGYSKSRIVKEALLEFLAKKEAEEEHDRLTLKGWGQIQNGEGLPAEEIYSDLFKWGPDEEI